MTHRKILCGITYDQIVKVAMESPSKKAAALKLGVGYGYLVKVTNKLGMGHLFRCDSYKRGPAPSLTYEDVLSVKGMIIKDAAGCLNVSRKTVIKAIKAAGLQTEFPTRGKAVWISRRGYAN